MRRKPVSHPPEKDEIEQLLAQLRRQVAQLRRLERASRDEGDLQISRQTIAELHWRLARLAGNHTDDGHYVAA
jgi:hypothetical protein